MPATLYYDKDASLDPLVGKTIAIVGYGSQGHAHAQNLRDSGMKVIVGLARGQQEPGQGRGRRLRGHLGCRRRQEGRSDHDPRAGPDPGQDLRAVVKDDLSAGKTLHVRPWLLHPLRLRVAADGRRRGHDRPEEPGSPLPRALPGGRRRAGLVAVEQDATGNAKEIALAYAKGLGLTRAGVIETTFKEEMRDRSVRRAGGALWRSDRADPGRFPDAGRGRLPAGDRLFRVPARGQADRRPDLRGRHLLHALLGQRHRGIRRLLRRPEGDRCARPPERCRSCSTGSRTARSPGSGSPRTSPAASNFLQMRADSQNSQIEQVGKGLRAMMPWLHKGKTPVDISA